MALEKQKVEKYKAEVQDYGERLGKEVQKMIDCSKTEEYFKEKNRMTKSDDSGCVITCGDCPLNFEKNGFKMYCRNFERFYPEKAVEIVQKWSNENPRKTIYQDFIEKYPYAPLDEHGLPLACAKHLGYDSIHNHCKNSCKECWNRPIE